MDHWSISIGFIQAIIMAAGAVFTWRAATSWREERRHIALADAGVRILSKLHLCCAALSEARSPLQFGDVQYEPDIAKLVSSDTEAAARTIYYPAGFLSTKLSRFEALEETLGIAEFYFSTELTQHLREILLLRDQVANSSTFLTQRMLGFEQKHLDTDTTQHERLAVFSGKEDAIQKKIDEIKHTVEMIIRDKSAL